MNIGKRLSIFLSIIFVLLATGCTVQKTEGQLYNEKVIEKAKEIDQRLRVKGYTKETIMTELLSIYCVNLNEVPIYTVTENLNDDNLNVEKLDSMPIIIRNDKLDFYKPLINNKNQISFLTYNFSCKESNDMYYREFIFLYDFGDNATFESEKKENSNEINNIVIPIKNHRDSINIPEMEAKQQHPRFAIFGDNYGTKFVSRDNYFKSNTNYDQKDKNKYEAEKKFWFIVDVFMQLDLPSE